MDLVKEVFVQSFCKVFGFEQGSFRGSAHSAKPEWMKAKAPGSPEFGETHAVVKKLRLNTVCQEAICPNAGECWSHHTATFMIMGERCTRRCAFCSVKDGTVYNLKPLDSLEPLRIAKAVEDLGLRHAVLTSVDRDDLPDMGADHFAACVRAIHHVSPDCTVEVLIPDMQGKRDLLERIVAKANVSILNHNLETVPRLYKEVRPGAKVERSLSILKWAKELVPDMRTKSGIMLGLGESLDEVLELMDLLREVDCDVLTIGQYLQPTPEQRDVTRYVSPEEFRFLEEEGLKKEFRFVESGPFVRSSYHAWKHAR
jgi:lipoic acid synthetase